MSLKNRLTEIINNSFEHRRLIQHLAEIGLPNALLAGGCITQAVWNSLNGQDALYRVKDFDVIYFDKHSSVDLEILETSIQHQLSLSRPIDIKNQATVHQWYGAKFGNEILPLTDVTDGLKMWLPCFSVGVRVEDGEPVVEAPFGLEDLFNKVVRPNKSTMSEQNYRTMTNSFKTRWPDIHIFPWSSDND